MATYDSDSWSTIAPRRRFFQQSIFWSGLALGAVSGIFILLTGLIVFGHRSAIPSTNGAQPGNIVISMDTPLLTTGMRLALKRAQNQLPFTISNVTAATHQGDRLDMFVTAPGPAGVTFNMLFGMAPVVGSNGQIDFKIVETQLGGLDIPGVNGIIENSLNQQFSDFGQGQIGKDINYQLTSVSTTDSTLVLKAMVAQQ